MIDFKEYAEKAMSCAIYPGRGEFLETGKPSKGLFYVCLKLQGECGEFTEKVGKCIRDNNAVIDTDRLAALLYELGDVLWYCCAISSEFGKDFNEVVSQSVKYPSMELTSEMSKLSLSERDAGSERYFYLCHRMTFHAALTANNVQFSDSEHPTGDPEHYYVFGNIYKIIACIALAASYLGSGIGSVARMNLDKLLDRKDRNKLQGSGDQR